MSADNFFLIRKHPLGGFTAVEGFASDEDEKGHQIMPEARITDRQFGTIKEAREWVEPEYAEYGISIHFECEVKPTHTPDPLSSGYMELENTAKRIYSHDELTCRGDYCTLHNRSNHVMRAFPQHWRDDRGIMERICPHGFGHPDPDEYRVRVGEDDGIHGCDGCCGDPK